MINYSTIKEMARESGITVKDLVALAPNNDPFYTGRQSELTAADWFADLWARFGYVQGVHLRRMHYQVVSQRPAIQRPDGQTYENTVNDWAYLNNAGKWARYLDLVSPEAFVDRRNPDASIYAYWRNPEGWDWEDPTPRYEVATDNYELELPELPELGDLPYRLPHQPNFQISGYDSIQQNYHVELWCEKTTMNDVLGPICRRYNVNLVTGAGEMSITAVVDFLKRVRQSERPARILYISDYDPAGSGMPISVARKIEFFQRNDDDCRDLDIRLQPVVLSRDQLETYDLPRVPVKDSDRRKANWEAGHGKGQVELDALEALYPGALAEIITTAILQYYDVQLYDRANSAKQALQSHLKRQRSEVIARYTAELDDLEHEHGTLLDDFYEVQNDFNELVGHFQQRIDAYKGRFDNIVGSVQSINDAIALDLKQIYIDTGEGDCRLPEPDLPVENGRDLYVSTRDYFDQLAAYKEHRHGTV